MYLIFSLQFAGAERLHVVSFHRFTYCNNNKLIKEWNEEKNSYLVCFYVLIILHLIDVKCLSCLCCGVE